MAYWFHFKFSDESSSFIIQTSMSFVWFYQSAFLSKFVAFYPRTVKRIVSVFPRANNGRSREKRKFWRSDLLTLSACTIGILSTLTYTEFDWAALLAML